MSRSSWKVFYLDKTVVFQNKAVTEKKSKEVIKRLLKEKINVKTGYTATSIREVHWHNVFYQNEWDVE